VPLTFELGWQRQDEHGQTTAGVVKAADAQIALR
jgi:hypothetical protein